MACAAWWRCSCRRTRAAVACAAGWRCSCGRTRAAVACAAGWRCSCGRTRAAVACAAGWRCSCGRTRTAMACGAGRVRGTRLPSIGRGDCAQLSPGCWPVLSCGQWHADAARFRATGDHQGWPSRTPGVAGPPGCTTNGRREGKTTETPPRCGGVLPPLMPVRDIRDQAQQQSLIPERRTCTAVRGRSVLRCSGRANHRDPVTPPHLPGGKPGSGPPPGRRFSAAD